MLFVAIVFFQAAFNPVDFDKAVTGVDDSANFPGVIRSTNCTHVYQPNVSGDALQLILDFVQGTVCTAAMRRSRAGGGGGARSPDPPP